VDIIDIDDLATDLEDEALTTNQRALNVVARTNALITEKWLSPVTPVPASVVELALAVAERALASTPGRGPLESLTRTFDDMTKTERFAVPGGQASGHAVYLTDDELGILNGGTTRRRIGSIKLSVPGY
jgi:hypothetical protein